MEDHVLGFRLGAHQFENMAAQNAAPMIVEPTPRRNAMDVARALNLRQLKKLFECEDYRTLDDPSDAQPPVLGLHLRLNAEIEYRPVGDELLARRQPVDVSEIRSPSEQSS